MTNPNAYGSVQASDVGPPISPITSRYLLVINVPLYADATGQLFAGQLWFKDLTAHLPYLRDFTIACPVTEATLPQDAVPLSDDPRCAKLKLVRLPTTGSLAQAIALLPVTVTRLWHAIAEADLVHTGVAGWPFPLGWLATPLARLRHRPVLMIVESAPWRLQPGLPIGWGARLRAGIYEHMARWCIRSADLAIYTQEEYRRSFPCRTANAGHVIHASWIDEDVVLSDQQAEQAWGKKAKALQTPDREIRFLFAGRLDAEKGVLVLLEAIKLIAKKDVALRLDVLGMGKFGPQCQAISNHLKGMTRVQMLGTVAYGAPLFELLRQYHALIVPSISDEQPRIVYDAYSQAVPVIGTSTPGLRDCIRDGETGWLVRPGNAAALAGALERGLEHPDQLQEMGLRAAKAAREMTHQGMHRMRQRLLLRLLQHSKLRSV